MAKLYFRYGTMNSSKTANALMVAFDYEEKGLKPLVLKPKRESREPDRLIRSRVGLSRVGDYLEDWIFYDTNGYPNRKLKDYSCVIIDEIQFADPSVISILRDVVTIFDIPVFCYGLKDDFRLEPFPASKELCFYADRLEEYKTVCWCGEKATCNARLDRFGDVVYEGDQYMPGDQYISLCHRHYLEGNIGSMMKARYRGTDDMPDEQPVPTGHAEAQPPAELKRVYSPKELDEFFGRNNWNYGDSTTFTFVHKQGPNYIILATDRLGRTGNGKLILKTGKHTCVYLQDWQVMEFSRPGADGAECDTLVKLSRKYFKPYEYHKGFDGDLPEEGEDFDMLVEKAAAQDMENTLYFAGSVK